MSQQLLAVNSNPNQTLNLALTVDGNSLNLQLFLHFNEVADYWTMSVTYLSGVLAFTGGQLLLDSIPLVTGNDPVCNVLRQYSYLKIGSCFIVNISGTAGGNPGAANLGTGYAMIWGDSP